VKTNVFIDNFINQTSHVVELVRVRTRGNLLAPLGEASPRLITIDIDQVFSNEALGPLGGHEQRPSLGSFSVIFHNPSVTIY